NAGEGASGQRAEPLANRCFTANAALTTELDEAWAVETEAPVSHRPLVEDGRVYVADWAGDVRCIDLETGEVTWERHVQDPNSDWPWHGFTGTGALGERL